MPMNPFRRFDRVLVTALAAAAAAFVLAACSSTQEDRMTISPVELSERIEAGTAPLVLDVRTPAEFADGHIDGAVNIPQDQLAGRVAELGIAPTDEVVVHCQSGRRAAKAEATLREAGYTNVWDLTGHMQAWKAAGLPLQQSDSG